MEDIIQKYRKEKKIKNLSIIVTSLALALWLNIALSSTDSWKYLKASVLNNQILVENKSDLVLENVKNSWNLMINLKSSKNIYNAKSISFSIVYNKDNVILKNKKVYIENWNIINLVDNNWFNTLVVNFKNPTNIKSWENIINIILDKKVDNRENINLINANVIDSDNNSFMLSTSGVEF